MRISSIGIAQTRQYNYNRKVKNTNAQMMQMSQTQQPSFKGLKAGLFGTIGAIAGGTIATILSGGAVLPVLLAGSAGTFGGCIYGKSKEGNSGDDDGYGYNAYCPNNID